MARGITQERDQTALLCVALLIALFWAAGVHAQVRGRSAEAIALTTSAIERNGRAQVMTAFRTGDGDTYSSSTLFPSVGILYLTRDGGDEEQCSGIVVGDRQILTAAHCVCGRSDTNRSGYRDFASCQPTLAKVRGRFFSPTAGFAELRGQPLVHPGYRHPDPASAHKAGTPISTITIFDLAILETDAPILAPSAEISREPAASARHVFAAIGPFAALPNGDPTDEANSYYPLTSKATLLQLSSAGADCGLEGARDTLCTLYTAYRFTDPSKRSTSACPSDSGGGLFGFENGRPGPLLGLASYVWPAHPPGDCISAVSQQTFFLDLTQGGLRDWVMSHVQRATTPKASCNDVLLYRSGRPYVLETPGLYGLAIISADETANFRMLNDDADVHCDTRASVSYCQVRPGVTPRLYVAERGVHVTLCWK